MEFNEYEYRWFKKLCELGYSPDVVYDIGASNGYWSDSISNIWPETRFDLFEPLAAEATNYVDSLADILASHSDFHLHTVGVADKAGEFELTIFKDSFSSSFIKYGDHDAVKERKIFPVVALDEYAALEDVPAPNVIKMDVQGLEGKIIEGGKKLIRNADIVQIEAWFYRSYGPETPLFNEIIEMMSCLDHVLVDIGGFFQDAEGRLYAVDSIFFSRKFLDFANKAWPNFGWRPPRL